MTTLNTVFFIISIFVAVIDIILTIVLIVVYRGISDKPDKKEYFVTGMSVQNRENEINTEIDYHGADRLGGTDNGEDVETVYKTVYKMSDYGNEPIIKDEEKK